MNSYKDAFVDWLSGMVRRWLLRAAPVALSLLAVAAPVRGEDVKLEYLYNLSSFTGVLQSSWVSFGTDEVRKELYVIDGSDQTVGVFNDAGLLDYSFGDEGGFGYIHGLAVDENGTIYLLSSVGGHSQVNIADFRGEPQGQLRLSGLPPLFTVNFEPDRIFYRKGHFYLVDTANFKMVETDIHGKYLDGLDFGSLMNVDFKKLEDFTIIGCTIDRDGNLIFTLPIKALVFIISPDGKLNSFGKRGSSPGKFNVIGGIATDDRGYLYVVDTLRCVIMVFDRDKDFSFKGEFGYRGWAPGRLIAPMNVAVLGGVLYVSQSANRGVSVFRVTVK